MKKVVLLTNVGSYVMESFTEKDGVFCGMVVPGRYYIICRDGKLYYGNSQTGCAIKRGAIIEVPDSNTDEPGEVLKWANAQIMALNK